MLLLFIHFYRVPHTLTEMFTENTCTLTAFMEKPGTSEREETSSYPTIETDNISFAENITYSTIDRKNISDFLSANVSNATKIKIKQIAPSKGKDHTTQTMNISHTIGNNQIVQLQTDTETAQNNCIHIHVTFVDFTGKVQNGEIYQDSWVYYQVLYGSAKVCMCFVKSYLDNFDFTTKSPHSPFRQYQLYLDQNKRIYIVSPDVQYCTFLLSLLKVPMIMSRSF